MTSKIVRRVFTRNINVFSSIIPINCSHPTTAMRSTSYCSFPDVLPMSQPITFQLFPSLPKELQGTIWEITCKDQQAEGRVLSIAPDMKWVLSSSGFRIARPKSHPIRTPSLLHTCQFMRKHSIKEYELWPLIEESGTKSNII